MPNLNFQLELFNYTKKVPVTIHTSEESRLPQSPTNSQQQPHPRSETSDVLVQRVHSLGQLIGSDY